MLAFAFAVPSRRSRYQPSVSFIIAAYNEEKVIEDKIKNALAMNYPQELIEIIIVSNGSNDSTAEIVEQYAEQGIISLHSPERRGKTDALNKAVAIAKNEVIIFSDANSMFESEAVNKLVSHFQRDDVGGVCGRKSVLKSESRKASLGDHLYWLYESGLKYRESQLGSIPTADGEIFAMRRELWKEIDPSIINDDTAITINLIEQGKRVLYEPEAITHEEASHSLRDDFNVKARMVYGGIQIMNRHPQVINPFASSYGTQFFFHKALRYFMWVLLAGIYLSNLLILDQNIFYKAFFMLQNLFYAMALVGLILEKANLKITLFYLPYYYCNVNLAAFKGFLFFLQKESQNSAWKKAER